MTGLLKPGTYRVTRDLPPVLPDRRKRHDWRAAPIKAGTLFSVGLPIWPDGKEPMAREIWKSGGYSHQIVLQVNGCVAGVTSLVSALEEVEETPSDWLYRVHGGYSIVREILDHLVEKGEITIEQVKTAAETVLSR